MLSRCILFLTLLVVLTAAAGPAHAIPSYSQVVLADNPNAYWRFEDASLASGAADSALGNGAQNGTYNGTATLIPAGIKGQGVDVTAGGAAGGWMQADVNVANNLTVEAWIKADTATWTASGWGPNSREANGFIIHPDIGAKTWRGFIINDAGAFTSIGTHNPVGAIDDQLHHYAITFDDAANTGRMYFDGVLVATNTGMTLNRSASDAITMLTGRDSFGTTVDRRGDGSFDEVAVYDSSLTGDRVKAHYMAGKGFTSFSGAADLDLQGKFVYAIDVGNTGAGSAGSVLGVNFTGEAVAGATVLSDSLITPAWATKPDYGPDAANNTLETIMHSIRFDSKGNTSLPAILVDLAVTPGSTYKLQLLFSENAFTLPGQRSFDIEVEGLLIVDEADILAATGAWTSVPTLGAVFTYEFIAGDSLLNIRLPNGAQFGNGDPILNALTLEDITPIPEPASLTLLAAAALAFRRRRAA